MAQLENTAIDRQGKGFSARKKQILRIDMTPMVDLGFLLITFFVFTTTISTPTVTDLFMADDTKIDPKPPKLPDELALSLLLDQHNTVYYYNGKWEDAKNNKRVFETNYSTWKGIGNVIREKQKKVQASGKFLKGKDEIMILIKPASGSNYKNIVDALDEMLINDVKKYAIIEPTAEELQFLRLKEFSGQ